MTRTYVPFRLFTLLIVLCLTTVSSMAQFALTRVSLDVSSFPKVTARVRATNSGTPVTLSAAQFALLESNISYAPTTVTPESNGNHVIEWYSSQFGYLSATVIAINNGSTATVNASSTIPKTVGGRVVVRDSMSRNVPYYLDYGTVPVGRSATYKLKIVATESALEGTGPSERPLRVESIATRTPEVKVVWKGSFGSAPPPVNIISPLEYRVDLVFTPTSSDPISDVLTVTYEGGMRTDIMISANPTTYPQRSILNVVSPNGGETFAPCQEVPISWSGMIAGFNAYVDVSTDNGRSWKFVDSTLDSSLVWTVPATPSSKVRVKVYQKFQSSNALWLRGEQAPVTSAAYSADSRYLLVAYSTGTIIEWDVVTATRVATYLAGTLPNTPPMAISYVGRTRDFVAAAARKGTRGGELMRFVQGTANRVATVNIPTDIEIRELGTDVNGSVLYVLPLFSGRIPTFDPVTLESRSPIVLNAAAASSALNGNVVGVSQVNGEVVTYDASTGAELGRSNTGIADGHGPYTHRFATSLSGRLVALAGKRLDVSNGAREQRTFIFDMQLGRIVKILYRESSDAVNLTFSPSDAFLGLGFGFNPQFVVYDLINGSTLPPTGGTDGHSNELTDLAFAPDGSTIVSTSLDSINNVLIRRVSTPESDISDTTFTIAPVELAITTVTMRPLLIGTTLDTVVTANVCNNGTVPAIFDWAALRESTWLKIVTTITADTLLPGECLQLRFTSSPMTLGLLTDTLALSVCGTEFYLPLEQMSLDRDLTVLTSIEDFGDVCIGTKSGKRLAMIRNNDSVDVTVNAVFVQGGLQAQFRVADAISDLILPPQGTLEVTVEFVPRRLGFDTSDVIIRYAGQMESSRIVRVAGRGSGADIQLSHRALAFIPEIPEREVVVRNNSENPVTIDSIDITAGEPFTLLSTLPITIGPRDSVSVRVRYEGGVAGSAAKLHLNIQPCATATDVKLAAYAGTANISTPIVEADPRSDTTAIPILVSITENVPYDGERFFVGVLRVHPRLFLASSISTTLGTATIRSQEIVNGVREIRFEINGSFRGTGEVARLIGFAGMAEVDSSVLTYDVGAVGFGEAVTETYADGLLRIIHPDPTRRIVDRTYAPIIKQITPQPATSQASVQVSTATSGPLVVRIVDQQGVDLVAAQTFEVAGGEHTIDLDVASLPPGVHMLILATHTGATTIPMVVIR